MFYALITLEIADIEREEPSLRQRPTQIFDLATARLIAQQRYVFENVDGSLGLVTAGVLREILADGEHEIGPRDREALQARQQATKGALASIAAEQLLRQRGVHVVHDAGARHDTHEEAQEHGLFEACSTS